MLEKSLKDSWIFFENHMAAIAMIILPIVIPAELLTAFYQYFVSSEEFSWSTMSFPLFLSLIIYPIYSIGVIFYIASVFSNDKIDTLALWQLGIKFWTPYIFLMIIGTTILLFGFILFIIPGIIIWVRYSFAEFDLLFNQNKPLDALKNSWNATKPHLWTLLGGYMIITIALYTPFYLISLLLDSSSLSPWVLWAFDTIISILFSVLVVFYTIVSFRVYTLTNEL